MNNSIAKKIEELMIENKMTQKDLAKLSGLTEAAISNYLSKKREPNKSSLTKIAQALNTTIDELQGNIGTTATLVGLGAALSSVAILSPIGMVSAIAGLASASVVSTNKKKKDSTTSDDILSSYEKELKRFKNISIGEIHEKLTEKEISFSFTSNTSLSSIENNPDYSLSIEDDYIKSWWFIFWKESSKLNKQYDFKKIERAATLISKFALTKPDKYRKSSIVIDDKQLYNAICSYEGSISYKGNLSVILFDENEMQIIKEKNISFYDDTTSNLITLV